MTYLALVSNAPIAFRYQSENVWRDDQSGSKPAPFNFRPEYKAKLTKEFAGYVTLVPSLIAEVVPLVLFWHSHRPVWQISIMMAAAWAIGWWLARIIATLLLQASRQIRPTT
jgi:hypothetical protein